MILTSVVSLFVDGLDMDLKLVLSDPKYPDDASFDDDDDVGDEMDKFSRGDFFFAAPVVVVVLVDLDSLDGVFLPEKRS